MKVRFYPVNTESDIIEVPDDTPTDILYDMACEWVSDNVGGFWVEVKSPEEDE